MLRNLTALLLSLSIISALQGAEIIELQSSFKAQPIYENSGFIQNAVTDICQDDDGYVWYATPNGAYKYDGYSFQVFYNEPKDINSIENNHILNAFKWVDGSVCFTRGEILNIFNPTNEKFHRITLPEFQSKHSVIDIAIDKSDGNILWVLTSEEIYIYRISEDLKSIDKLLLKQVNHDTTQNKSIYRRIIISDEGYIWLLSNSGVSCNRLTDGGIEELFFCQIENTSSFVETQTNKIVVFSKNTLSVITPKIEYQDFEVRSIDFQDVALNDLLLAPDGDIIGVDWDNALYNINLDDATILTAKIDAPNRYNKRFKYRAGYIDNSGILWVGTRHGGLCRINLNYKPFNSFSNETNDVYPNQITADSNGNVYIGTHYNGIVHTNIERAGTKNNKINQELGINTKNPIFAVDFWDDYLFYATVDGAIYRAKCTKSAKVISHEKVANVNEGLGFFYRSKRGRLYYGVFSPATGGEVYYCDNSSSNSPRFRPLRDSSSQPLFSGGIASILEDSDGVLWVGTTNKGLYRFTLDEDGTIVSNETIELEYNIDKNNIFALAEDDRKRLYVGTFGGGMAIIELDKISNKDSYKYFTRADGLSNNAIYSIVCDGADHIWISTDDGLSRFNTTDSSFRNYNTSDGILSVNFRKWSACRSVDNFIFFGGTKGVSYFHPDYIKTNSYPPTVRITAFEVNGEKKEYLPYTYSAKDVETSRRDFDGCRLTNNEKSFSIEFASMHFDNPDKNLYQYMLKGVDKGWQNSSAKNRRVNYSNVPSGEYYFYVRGTNSDGVWSKEYEVLKIKVLPHWSATWWARIIYLILLLIVVRLFYVFTRERYKHRMDSQMNQAKLDFFTNVSHEIKTPLTIISAILDGETEKNLSNDDKEIIRRNNKRMLSLVTQLLDFRKVTQGHAPFHPSKGDIIRLLRNISESFESLASKSGIRYHFTPTLDVRECIFESDKIEKIVSNLLSNAFKHTSAEGGEIELSLTSGLPSCAPQRILKALQYPQELYTTISVRDNGEGIAAEHIDKIFERFYQVGKYDLTLTHRGVGVGLAYSKLLTELHEGYIYVVSQVGKGSTFYVTLPHTLKKTEEVESEAQYVDNVEFILPEKMNSTPFFPSPLDEPSDREVLIVEDNIEIRNFLRKVLSPLYKVHEATDGQEGLEMAEALLPDVIVSDVMMPRMDGLTMCDRLKNGSKTNHIPIILLTANSTMEHRVEGLRTGADSYIAKPFNLEHLKVRIEKLLEIRTTLKSKYMQFSGVTDLEDIDIHSADKEFLAEVEQHIEQNLDNSEFAIENLEQAMGYSRTQLYRKIKSISGVSVVEFIRNYRLKRSIDIMKQGNVRIAEIVYAVGFATPSYFGKCFKKRYGKTPAEFMEEMHEAL